MPVKEATSDATQTTALVFHPPILLIQMKRTQYDRRTYRQYKDYRSVPFPLCIASSRLPTIGDADEAGGAGGAASAAATVAHEDKCYRLEAVIIHNGRTSGGGHYYALTREVESVEGSHVVRWLEKNDQYVDERSEDDVLLQDEGWCVLAYELEPSMAFHRASC